MLSEHPVLAEHTPLQVAAYLREIGDTKTADAITKIGSAGGQGITLPLKTYPWMCANHVIGYVAPGGKSGRLSISPAVEIEPDADLIGKAIKINLNKFHVNDYPGILKHTVLMEFTGRSQTGDTKEDLRFTTVCEIKNKDSTSAGLPIFTGVRVPADGLAFDGRTLRVKGDGDEMILGVLKSKTFQRGITLLAHAQPALPMLTQMSAGVVEYLLKQSRNRAVQRFDLGLDFSRSGTSAQLRLTALSASPTRLKAGKPPPSWHCTSTGSTSMPWKATVGMRVSMIFSKMETFATLAMPFPGRNPPSCLAPAPGVPHIWRVQ